MKKILILIAFLFIAALKAGTIYPIPTIDNVLKSIGTGSKKELNPHSIKMLIWNLHKGQDEAFEADFKILTKNKDILLLQEMYLDKKMSDVFSSMTNFTFKTATSFFDPRYPTIRTGVSTASLIEPLEYNFVRTEILEPGINTPKVTMITRYPIAGTDKILTVANIHSINFVTAHEFRIELERVFNVLKKYPKPIIFAGDFNTWLGEKIFFLDQLRISMNMREANFQPDFRMYKNGYYLDHFLYTDDLEIISASAEGKYMGSDHKPMQVEVEYVGN